MSEISTMLGDTVNRLLGDLVSAELLAAAEDGVWPVALWKAVGGGADPAAGVGKTRRCGLFVA